MSVERTLKRFKPNEPFERTSWEIVDDRNLFYRKFMVYTQTSCELNAMYFQITWQR